MEFLRSHIQKASPILLVICLIITQSIHAATKTSALSGAWGNSATWTPAGVPASGDNVIIQSGHTVTVNVNTQNINDIVIQANAVIEGDGTGKVLSLSKGGGEDVTNNGTIEFSGAKRATIRLNRDGQWGGTGGVWNLDTLNLNGKKLLFTAGEPISLSLFAGGDPILNPGTLTATSSITFQFAGSTPQTLSTNANVKYGNVESINPAGLSILEAISTTKLLGDLRVKAGGVLSNNGFSITGNSGKTFEVANGGIFRMTGASGLPTGFSSKIFGVTSSTEYVGTNQTVPAESYGHLLLGGSGVKTMPALSLTISGDFSVRGTCSATAQAGIVVNGSVMVDSNASFSAGSFLHTIRGAWTVRGTFNCGTSTVSFSGPTRQMISGSTFRHLVVDNPSGVMLTGNVHITSTGTLSLLNGNLETGGSTLNVLSTDVNALSLGTNAVRGNIVRSILPGSTSSYKFMNQNCIVTLNGINNPSTISLTERPAENPPYLPSSADTSRIVRRYYSLAQSGAGTGFQFSLRLPYEQSEVRGNESLYSMWGYQGTTWVNMGSSNTNPADNYVEQSALEPLTYWSIAESEAALPVQISHFQASQVPNQPSVRLDWVTISEVNNFGFVIQRREGSNQTFADVPGSFVPGQGTSLVPHPYEWTHEEVDPGTYGYRLRQIDLDGTVHHSEAVEVTVGLVTSVTTETSWEGFVLAQNYPNPFNPSTTIRFSTAREGRVTLFIYDVTGQLIATVFDGHAPAREFRSVSFDGASLPSGVYLYVFTDGRQSIAKRMVLAK